jgi:hypothetical protein
MLVLEWGSQHQHGNVIQSNAFTDDYGNAIDYWTHYDHSWSFHIFRVAANQAPSNLDLASLVDYLDTQVTDDVTALDPDLWVSGIEVGTEYWDDTSGEATFSQFDATVNGQTATSGGAGTGSGTGSSGTGGSGGSGSSDTGGTDGSGTTGGWWGSGTGGSDGGSGGGSDGGTSSGSDGGFGWW